MHCVLVALGENQYNSILMEEDLRRLESAVKVVKRTDLLRADEDTLVKALKEADADILMTSWGAPRVNKKVLDGWPALKYVAHCAGEVKGFLARDAIEAGLVVTNWGDITSRSTAEGALAMTLAILRRYQNMPFWTRDEGLYWELPDDADEGLFEQRVGLHGLGAIAQEYVKLIKPYDCRVSAYSPHCPDKVFEELGVKRANSLEELYGTNRIISCHAANTPTNFHIVDAKILALIEDGGYFINTGRGPVVDTQALIVELESERIYAALDVFEEEPLPADSVLRRLSHCFVVPHRAGPTPDRRRDMGKYAVDNVLRHVQGEDVIAVITTRKYDLMT